MRTELLCMLFWTHTAAPLDSHTLAWHARRPELHRTSRFGRSELPGAPGPPAAFLCSAVPFGSRLLHLVTSGFSISPNNTISNLLIPTLQLSVHFISVYITAGFQHRAPSYTRSPPNQSLLRDDYTFLKGFLCTHFPNSHIHFLTL